MSLVITLNVAIEPLVSELTSVSIPSFLPHLFLAPITFHFNLARESHSLIAVLQCL